MVDNEQSILDTLCIELQDQIDVLGHDVRLLSEYGAIPPDDMTRQAEYIASAANGLREAKDNIEAIRLAHEERGYK